MKYLCSADLVVEWIYGAVFVWLERCELGMGDSRFCFGFVQGGWGCRGFGEMWRPGGGGVFRVYAFAHEISGGCLDIVYGFTDW